MFDGRAAAYGGTGTATGFVVVPAPGRLVAFDLHGRAAGVDLTRLPAITGCQSSPAISRRPNTSTGAAGRVEGSAVLDVTARGATIGHGTVARFETANGAVSYASTGQISNVNLQRVGRAFHIAALDTPE